MPEDEAPKSAFELAMERLRKKDQEGGAAAERPLTEAQRVAIAEARKVYEARQAELEILHRSKLARMDDPAARDVLEEEYRRDRERIAYDRDRKLDEIRRGAP
jgi:hypothetical protein